MSFKKTPGKKELRKSAFSVEIESVYKDECKVMGKKGAVGVGEKIMVDCACCGASLEYERQSKDMFEEMECAFCVAQITVYFNDEYGEPVEKW